MSHNKKYLVMLNVENNNYKYYQMEERDGMLVVSYGRMGGNEQVRTYDISQWDKKYNEKINKGYKDMSDVYLVKEEPADDTMAALAKSQTRGKDCITFFKSIREMCCISHF